MPDLTPHGQPARDAEVPEVPSPHLNVADLNVPDPRGDAPTSDPSDPGPADSAPARPAFNVPAPDNFTLTLTLGGRFAGTQDWTLHLERGSLVARVQTDFGGVLPPVRRVQTSRMHPRWLTSQSYSEGDGRGRAHFETIFDRRAGLITLRQGREEATQPLTTDHHDPVSLLLWLRTRCAEGRQGDPLTDRQHAHLTGGRVLIQRLPDGEIAGTPACGYFLRPGNAYMYLDAEPPHRVLRLIQPTDFGPVEANLTTQPARPKPERERRRR